MLPGCLEFVPVFRMQQLRPIPLREICKEASRELFPLAAEIIHFSGRHGGEDFLRHRLCHKPQTGLTVPNPLFRSLPLCYIARCARDPSTSPSTPRTGTKM